MHWLTQKAMDECSGTKGTLGLCQSHNATIGITKGLSDQDMAHTFYHELCHAIATTMGWSEWNDNEDKIDAVAGLLHQFSSTRK